MSASDEVSAASNGFTQSTSTTGPHFSINLNALPQASGLEPVLASTGHRANPSAHTTQPFGQSSFSNSGERQHKLGDSPSRVGPSGSSSTTEPPRTTSPPQSSMAAALGQNHSSFPGAISPKRGLHSSSPRHLSPATSQIFERDVQEDFLDPSISSAIPHHLTTEDQIPSVLDAASTAITDSHLSPEDVEIVMSSAHQPAAVTVGGASPEERPASAFASHSELGINHEPLDANSTYGNVDPTDLRRLSFISFADVIHAEQAHADGSSHAAGLSSASPSVGGNRSPSPMRAQAGSDRLHAPSGLSPSNASAQGELTIETLRQTLDKTGVERSGSVNRHSTQSQSRNGGE